MKKYIINILTALSLLLVAVSCNDIVLNENQGKTGYLSVSLGVDDDVVTKATVSPSADMAFQVQVYKGTELVATVDDHRTLTSDSPLVLPVGTYRVVASYGDPEGIGFDKPYYKGEAEAVITTDDLTKAEVVCTLANSMVTVEFDESITDNCTSYAVYIANADGHGFEYDSSLNNFDAVGYLPPGGSLKWNLQLILANGNSSVASDLFNDLKPQHHYHLKFSMVEDLGDMGYLAIKLIVDNTVVEQEYQVELDFSEAVLPVFSSNEEFVLTNEMSVIVGDDTQKELTFTAEEGIKSLLISVDADVMTKASSMNLYELVDASAATISELAAMGIKTESVVYGAQSAKIDITDYIKALPTGDYNVDVTLYDIKGHVANCPMDFAVISDVDADIVSVTPWAEFAIVKGKYFAATVPEGTTFMYKKASASSWTTVSTSSLTFDSATKTFEAEIGGLEGNTSYQIKAVSAAEVNSEESRVVTFQTETAETLYNMDFEYGYYDGKIWYPYAEGASPAVWDCANPATASFVQSYTTPSTYTATSSSTQAVCLESEYVVIKFAAGNLFTGKFGEIIGTKGASLDWGTPFSSRPVALRGYYDYTSGEINKAASSHSGMKGQPDKCQILAFLTDWSEPFTINTVEGQFVDFSESNKSIIAVGKLESEVTTGGYLEFTIPFEYRDLTKTPTYIVITCCSSYLGDYFTGSTDSMLYVDEFSFEYDVTKLTDEQKAKVNYR